MMEQFTRTERIFGHEAMEKLAQARVAVFGAGGVGGYVIEALARSGVGALDIIDNDTIKMSNINRQIYALMSTLGQYKTDVAEARIRDISPDCKVRTYRTFFMPDNADEFNFTQYDYVVDAIDTVTGKIELIMRAQECGVQIISSMGTGNKTDPTAFRIADIYKTSVCPLARVMRHELKKRGVKKLKVLYSTEQPIVPLPSTEKEDTKKVPPASNAFTPSVAGLIIAGEVVKDLIGYGAK